MKRPFEISNDLFPFESKFIKITGHDLHYIDEGKGKTIVFCHGNPTWSLLYASMIRLLKENFRCIAIDYPGFGMSSKPSFESYPYTPDAHSEVLGAFIDEMNLESFSVFVQDWGGPIGLNAACDRADKIEHLFIGNTWAWEFKAGTPMGDSSRNFSNKMGGDDMKEKIMRKNSFLSISMPLLLRGVRKRNKHLSPATKAAYLAPFSTPESRIPTWVFPRSIVRSEAFLQNLEAKLDAILNKPTVLFWGEKDVVFPVIIRDEWESRLKNYTNVNFPDASHFFQDEESEGIAEAIKQALS